MTPADELRAAATKLREPLPGDLVATPRLVMTESETVSGIAFCADHQLPSDDEHEFAACDNCEVIDCLHERLARLVLALLLARDSLTDLLDGIAHNAERHEAQGWGNDQTEVIPAPAAALARTINGRQP